MSDTIDVEIKGLDELEKNLLTLGAELGAKTLRGALRDSAKPMKAYMVSHAPESEKGAMVKDLKGLSKRARKVKAPAGELKRRIKIKSKLNKTGSKKGFSGSQAVIVRVGVFRAYYAYFLEFGTKYRPAMNFIRGAESTIPVVLQTFKKRLARRIILAERKLKKTKQ